MIREEVQTQEIKIEIMNNKFLMTLALCLCSSSLAYAQKRISGRVWSKQDGPIVMAYVVEQD